MVKRLAPLKSPYKGLLFKPTPSSAMVKLGCIRDSNSHPHTRLGAGRLGALTDYNVELSRT